MGGLKVQNKEKIKIVAFAHVMVLHTLMLAICKELKRDVIANNILNDIKINHFYF